MFGGQVALLLQGTQNAPYCPLTLSGAFGDGRHRWPALATLIVGLICQREQDQFLASGEV